MTRQGITQILLPEYINSSVNGIPLNNTSGLGTIFPSNAVDYGQWADEVTFILNLSGVTGSPTSWSIQAKFQVLVPGTHAAQFQQRIWADLHSYNVAAMVNEGVGFGTDAHPSPADGSFGTIADQTDSLSTPITVVRTVRNFGRGVRVALNLTSSGGSSPAANLGIITVARMETGR